MIKFKFNITWRKLVYGLVLRLAVYPYIFAVAAPTSQKVVREVAPRVFVNSYVTKIDTPTYGNEVTKNYLDQFNKQGGGIIVAYEFDGQGLDRTITIEEAKTLNEADTWVGLAKPGVTNCTIKIKTGKSYRSYYFTLLHEYLHCMGYNHVDNPKDLMYPSESYESQDESVAAYAKQLEVSAKAWKELWKSLKN